jgi:hypothetical protein
MEMEYIGKWSLILFCSETFSLVLRMEPNAMCMLGKHSAFIT